MEESGLRWSLWASQGHGHATTHGLTLCTEGHDHVKESRDVDEDVAWC